MLTAAWSWKGNVDYLMNITLKRGGGETRENKKSLVSAEFSDSTVASGEPKQPTLQMKM